jgi:uncharacterized SAM-binding protein YcdF (DUF218 family)
MRPFADPDIARVNDLLVSLGLESWKSLIAVLILPPVPFLVMILLGARLMFGRRLIAWLLVLTGCAGLWISATPALGKLMRTTVHPTPSALDPAELPALRKQAEAEPGRTAIVVLGGGRRELSPEYGVSNVSLLTLERLRYGIWLGRELRTPVAYSGGLGHGGRPGATEAEIAARVAEREFGRPLKWLEDRSRDTTENGMLTVPLLQAEGITRIVLVTHDFHMPRALRAFQRAAAREGRPLEILPAPVGLRPLHEWEWQDWLPTRAGHWDAQLMLHEWLGYLLGA